VLRDVEGSFDVMLQLERKVTIVSALRGNRTQLANMFPFINFTPVYVNAVKLK
jgi:hypothetical protein